MCEAEVVITIGVDENDQMLSLTGISEEIPVNLMIDNVPAFFHTVYNFFAYGLSRITILCPSILQSKVQNLLEQMDEIQLVQCKKFMTFVKPKIVTYSESETAIQRLSRMVTKGQQRTMMIQDNLVLSENQRILEGTNDINEEDQDYIESQNIIIVNGNSYIDVPPTIFLDVHRQTSATLTILHSQPISSFPTIDSKSTPITFTKTNPNTSNNSVKASADAFTQTKQQDVSPKLVQTVIQKPAHKHNYNNGCIQIGQRLNLNATQKIPESALSYYAVYDVSFFAYLNKKRLSDWEQDMIQYPLSVIHDDSEFTKYTERPVGVVIASEILLYLGDEINIQALLQNNNEQQSIVGGLDQSVIKPNQNKKTSLKLDLYEELIIFLTEQQQLKFDCMHPRIQQYLTYYIEQQTSNKDHLEQYEIEKGLTKQLMLSSYQYKVNSLLRENIEQDTTDQEQQQTILDHERIFNKYIKEDYIDIQSNNLITNTYKRSLKTMSFQFVNSHVQFPVDYENIYEQVSEYYQQILTENRNKKQMDQIASIQSLGRQATLPIQKQQYKPQNALTRQTSVVTFKTMSEKSIYNLQNSIDIGQISVPDLTSRNHTETAIPSIEEEDGQKDNLLYPLDCYMGGMYNISGADEYLYVSLAHQQFLFKSQQAAAKKSLKVQLLFKELLDGFNDQIIGDIFKNKHNFIAHPQFLSEVNMNTITNTTFYPRRQKQQFNNASTADESNTESEDIKVTFKYIEPQSKSPENTEHKRINGQINNCIIYTNTDISAGVTLNNCIVFANTQIDGDFVFENCIIGKSCSFKGQGKYTNCIFKLKYKYDREGDVRKGEILVPGKKSAD